jgi:DNA-directed RNA polymerase specialized sigma24 family protein
MKAPSSELTSDGMKPMKQRPELGESRSFEEVVLPHLDAAYNLARWLVRNGPDADDVVQDAYLRAFQSRAMRARCSSRP